MTQGPGNELRHLSVALYGAPRELLAKQKPIFKRAAQNIKNDWQENLRESKYFGQLARAVSYDDLSTDTLIDFEIGTEPSPEEPSKHGGSLIGIAMGYNARGGGGNRIDPVDLLEPEAGRIQHHIDQALRQVFGA